MWTGPDWGCILQTDHPRQQPLGTLQGAWEQMRLERTRVRKRKTEAERQPHQHAGDLDGQQPRQRCSERPRGKGIPHAAGTVRAPRGCVAKTWPNPTACAADGPCPSPRTP